jgi:hypothetical protein
MFRDDHLEYKNGTLQVKMQEIPGAAVKNNISQKPKRTTKFDFSGTNYETCTLGHVACMEIMLEEDPELIENICQQARDIVGVHKLVRDDHDSNEKYATLQTDPEFLARALLFENLKRKKGNGKDEVIAGNGNEGNNFNSSNHGYKVIYNDKDTLQVGDEDNCSDNSRNHHSDEDMGNAGKDDINTNAANSDTDASDIYVSEMPPVDASDSEVDLDSNAADATGTGSDLDSDSSSEVDPDSNADSPNGDEHDE